MLKKNSQSRFVFGVLFLGIFFGSAHVVYAAPVKILSNSRHAFGTIGTTIDQLLGRAHSSTTEFIIHSTTMDNTFAGYYPTPAIATSTSYYDESGSLVPSQAPYSIYTTSFTGNPGDSVGIYNQFSGYDLTDNYAFTNSPAPLILQPTTLYTSPGGSVFSSAAGVEWTLDPVVFCSSTLSCLTAANAGIMGWLRFNHPTWNIYDVKAAMRQSGTNWATGYNRSTYGFGTVNATTTNALADNQILLQPPEVATSTSGLYNQLTFAVYPFRQTRRVKEVLFQFATSSPGFQANELTLAQIQALGGTKIIEYTGTNATTSTPLYTPVTNAYFVWFTADNSTDSMAKFSRIDTYSPLGPLSQNEISFSTTFDTVAPTNNAVSSSVSPTFSWGAPQSYFGVSKYQLFIDGVLNRDNITGTSTTPIGNLSEGTHTWYVKAFNGNGATLNTLSTPTININTAYTSGYVFYVDNVLGNDNNPGTQALPWATLTKAGNTAQAGDTVVIIKNVNQPYRDAIAPLNNGTASAPITFRGVDVNHKPEVWGSTTIPPSGWSVYSGGNANTYQYSTTTSPIVLAAGATIPTVTKRVRGTSETSLNPGEWRYTSGVLYYRLLSGESIGSLIIEAGGTQSISITSSAYNTYRDIVVRFGDFGMQASDGTLVDRVEVYDSRRGITVSNGDTNARGPTVRYSIFAGNTKQGMYVNMNTGAQIYNNISYGNSVSAIYFFLYAVNSIVENNISSGNTTYSLSGNGYYTGNSVTVSYNTLQEAIDPNAPTLGGNVGNQTGDPLLVSTSTRDFTLQQFSPDIDAGIAISGLTTDILGNHIYGTPDIGPYEYQPPYTIASSSVPIGGSVRVYKDGKYRMTTATSSSATANLTVTPVGGFPTGDYSEFLNITISKWNTSGDYSKTWTESSPAATSTVHTLGDLKANTYYAILVDGVQYVTVLTDGSGLATFTYTGGYSTHTFDVSEDTTPPVAFTDSSPVAGANTSSSPTLTWNASSDAASGLAKYQLYVDGSLTADNIATTTTQTSVSNLSCGNHTWYVRAFDNAGNTTNSDTQTFSVSCGGGVPSLIGVAHTQSNVSLQTGIISTSTSATTTNARTTKSLLGTTVGATTTPISRALLQEKINDLRREVISLLEQLVVLLRAQIHGV